MLETACKKEILADALGVRLLYCKNCDVVELEIGAISIRLSPDNIQRIANVMMKASLKLDRLLNTNKSQMQIEPHHLH